MKKLAEKVLAVQKSVGPLVKDQKGYNNRYSFFDINQLLNELQPILIQNGLMVIQPLTNVNGVPGIKTILIDKESGESLEDVITFQDDSDPQKVGSKITYYRRYALQSLFGLQAEDDDGHKASSNTPKTQQKELPWLNKTNKDRSITDQWSNLVDAINDGKITSVDEVRKHYKVSKETAKEIDEVMNYQKAF